MIWSKQSMLLAVSLAAMMPAEAPRSTAGSRPATAHQQVATGTWSSRRDVPPPAGFKPIFDYPVVNDYRSFLVNERELVALRKRFEGYTGPVVNAGGVR